MARVTIQANDKLITTYRKELNLLRLGQDVHHEGATSRAFANLLEGVGKKKKWTLVPELRKKSALSSRSIIPDGTMRDEWHLPHGYWEAKDADDNLEVEVAKKTDRGYSLDNIIFENTERAILYQNSFQVVACSVADRDGLAELLTRFLNYEIEPFEDFEEAITRYSEELTHIATSLKGRIDEAHERTRPFQTRFAEFMDLCRSALNPNISKEAVDEMLIQHLMTERIIRRVFSKEDFVRKNVIASEIEDVIDALASQSFDRKEFLGSLDRFYKAIERAADELASHEEKQTFINSVYEKFFQGYSVKVADTHGIVYTPQEIVDFMCAAVEEVLESEFGKKLGDEGVVIIDPATGTGNFVVNLLRRAHARNLRKFEDFYRKRLFANEVMLMPYYIASLNIEREYYELTGRAAPFEGLCFVDTLDLAKISDDSGKVQFELPGEFSKENTERIERQNNAEINVIIGNPPYNVGQVNENDNNKNRKYDVIDLRIRDTYAKDSKATLNTALADAYVKFFRWAVDRLEDRPGILCFVSNNSFVDQVAFDGMRKHLSQDFDRIYHLDLHGNVRQNPRISGTTHNVFGIQVGVGITVAVRSPTYQETKLLYHRVPDDWRKDAKLSFLESTLNGGSKHAALDTIQWRTMQSTNQRVWLESAGALEFQSFVAMGNKLTRKSNGHHVATIFATYSTGTNTARDKFVYDFNVDSLTRRMEHFASNYNLEVDRYKRTKQPKNVDDFVDYSKIKWSRNLKRRLKASRYIEKGREFICDSLYRPFTKKHLYFEQVAIDERGRLKNILPDSGSLASNVLICVPNVGHRALSYLPIVTDLIPNYTVTSIDGFQCFPFYTYDEDGSNRRENITDWALDQFRSHYHEPAISKWDIFYYVYGLLHHPGYRERYALDLKRNLPRIPFAPDFRPYAGAGAQLADLHLNYESADRYQLDWQSTRKPVSYRVEKMLPKGKVDSAEGNYKVYSTLKYNDTLTLSDIPQRAFAYRLGNRSALDWIVDQYRVKTDKRSGITHDPNGYSDDPQYILKLIERVITVSLRTVDIVEELAKLPFRDESADDCRFHL